MLANWVNFFSLTGEASATLAGLLFVVITLNTKLSTARTLDIAHASISPALYSFTDVLLQSMVVLVPWGSDVPCGVALAVLGLGGLVYRVNRVWVRKRLKLRAVRTLVERVFHNALPVVASLVLVVGGVGLAMGAAFSPYAIAGSSSLLLISAIYRTWGETLALIETRD